VCHSELPSRDLPNSETLREAHISGCFNEHSTAYNGTRRRGSTLRSKGMFPYVATEKDCVDSAECNICFEEFKVGDELARLECLCHWHRRCIMEWFRKQPGKCPVHDREDY
jgi:hypothetical protein